MSEQEYGDAAYGPFGETYSIKNTPYLSFTGAQPDTIAGLNDFLYREYSPVQGRWLRPDPSGVAAVSPGNPQSWNRYAYVQNNPLSAVDPLGLDCDTSEDSTQTPDGQPIPVLNVQPGDCLLTDGPNAGAPATPPPSQPVPPVVTIVNVTSQSPDDVPSDLWWLYRGVFTPHGSWLQNTWNYLKKVPVNLTVIVPVLGIAGPAVTVTYLPQTNNLCVAPGLGASIGRNVSAGPLVLGNLANAKSITEGASISVGAQALPIAGAQATGNQSGILGGPTVGIPGGSVTATYGICF
jgi:RHS repeat-associated protein